MGQTQLQCDYRGGGHGPTYGRMGMCVSSGEGCTATLGSERAPKCFTAEGSTPLRVVCIFPRERIEKTPPHQDI